MTIFKENSMGKNSFAADIDEAIEGNVEEIEIDQEAILNSLVKQNGFKFYTSEVFYNFHPDAIRPKRFRIVDFVDEIVKTFDIALEHQEAFSKIRQEDDQNIPHLLFHEFENHGLVFRDGVFYREKKPIVRINTIVLQRERLIINVDGSEEPIEIIKNEVANLIEKYNFSKTSEYSFDSYVQRKKYGTVSTLNMGFPLSTVISPALLSFFNEQEQQRFYNEMILSSDIDSFSKSDIKYSMDVDSIKFVISLFNTVTGTDDRVTISMDVTNRREYRTGIVTIKTELNNLMHAELVHKVIALFDKEEQDG